MKNNIFEPKIECANKSVIRNLQLKKFNKTIGNCKKSKLYSKANFPNKINTLQEISKIPFTTKKMLRDSYPYDSLCVGKDEVIEIHTSSGTS